MLSSALKPCCAASAAFTPSIAASPAWYSRATLVFGGGGQTADEVADKRDRLRHLRCIEPQQLPGGNRGGEDRDEAAVKPAAAKAGGDRLADPPRRLVAQHDRRQHLLAAGAGALGDGERRRGQRRAGMDDLAQIAVVEAAASLITALTCAASASGSLGPASNHSVASGRRRARAPVPG